jgi:PEP-CTERM motif
MMGRFRVLPFVVAVSLVVVRAASATPITWEFAGLVSDAHGPYTGVPPDGSLATLDISWDPSTPNQPGCGPGSGRYAAITGASLTVLGVSHAFGGGAIEVNAPQGNCNSGLQTGTEFHMFTQDAFGLFEILADPNPVNMAGNNLLAMLSNVTGAGIFVQGVGNSGFEFKGARRPVPEPASLLLLGSGLATFAAFRRRKRLKN